MSYIASVLARSGAAWSGQDLDLSDVDDLDELADRMRDQPGEVAVFLLEEDDEYVAVVRVDRDGDEAQVFLSDRRVLDGSGLAARLFGESLEEDSPVTDEEDEEESSRPEVEPAGDASLLADLGVDADRLTSLCAEEGMLPSDVIFAVGEHLGAADVLEQVRGV